MANDVVQVNFRMPAELKAALERAAERERRTLTAEIVSRLYDSFPRVQQELDLDYGPERDADRLKSFRRVTGETRMERDGSVVIRLDLDEIKELLAKAELKK